MSRRGVIWGYGLVALAVLLLAGYAVVLNQTFYQFQGPFYDSLSYYNFMCRLIGYEHIGDFASIAKLTIFHSTVVLPWIQILCFGPFFDRPPRWIGSLSESFWLLILALSLFRYFFRVKKLPLLLAFAYTLPFISGPFIFRRNGGLSDFRMDLLQYLLLSTTSVFCLIALKSKRYRDWSWFGVMAGCTCLVRATTPVYLVLIYLPVLLWSLKDNWHRKQPQLKLFAVAALSLVLVSGWYFIVNFDYLHFYYMVWNIDANAHLRIKRSIQHVLFVRNDIGVAWLCFCSIAFAHGIFLLRKHGRIRLTSFNWPALWMGLVPCVFLVIVGAGLNEWVSLPSVFILLFFLLPVDGIQRCAPRTSGIYFFAALAILLQTACPQLQAYRQEQPWISARKSGLNKIQTAIESDMQGLGKERAKLTCTFADAVNNRALANCWMFDKGFQLDPNTMTLKRGNFEIFIDERLNYPAPTDWREAPGKTEDEKINAFVQTCLSQDYLIVPTKYSAGRLAIDQAAVLNLRIFPIRDQLLGCQRLTPITGPIYCTPNETVIVYRVARDSD